MNKDQIKDLQRRLNATGERLAVDGILGPKTRAAMQRHPEVQSPGAAPAAEAGGMTDQQVREEAERRYGAAIGPYLDHPEVGPLLRMIAKGEIDQAGFDGRMRQTAFWQQTQGTARDWDAKKKLDPASAAAQIDAKMATLRATAGQIGIRIDDIRLRQISEDSLRLGWNDAQMRQAIGSEINYQAGNAAGIVAKIREQASSYMVTLNEWQLEDLSRRLARGELGEPEFENWLKGEAKKKWPALTASIDAGLSPRDTAEQYGSVAEKVLGTPKQTIDWNDGKWNSALHKIDEKTGQARVLSYAEWESKLKSEDQYGWRWTENAREQATSFALGLAGAFGKRRS